VVKLVIERCFICRRKEVTQGRKSWLGIREHSLKGIILNKREIKLVLGYLIEIKNKCGKEKWF